MTFYGFIGDYTNQQVYAGVNDAFPDERAGYNGSSNENNVQGEGDDDWFEASFKYFLPIGHAKKSNQ